MRIGVIDYLNSYLTAGEVRVVKCEKCGGLRAIVKLLPYEPVALPHRWEGVLIVRESRSRSGAHFCEDLIPKSRTRRLPTHMGVAARGKFRLIPAEFEDVVRREEGIAVARFRKDAPFAHEVIVLAQLEDWVEEGTEPLCPKCWVEDITQAPTLKQGHLYLKHIEYGRTPRLWSEYQPGVEKTTQIFNHEFSAPVFARGKRIRYGAFEIARGEHIIIRSPDHDELVIWGHHYPGWWEFYHPSPAVAD